MKDEDYSYSHSLIEVKCVSSPTATPFHENAEEEGKYYLLSIK